jgi:hypothetical protein
MLAGLEMRAGADKERGLMIFDQSSKAKILHSLVTEFRKHRGELGRTSEALAEIPMFNGNCPNTMTCQRSHITHLCDACHSVTGRVSPMIWS